MVIIMQFINLVSFVHLASTDKGLSGSDSLRIVNPNIIMRLTTFNTWNTALAAKTGFYWIEKPARKNL